MKNKRICFVAPNIYPLLDDTDQNFIGGAELQQVLIGDHIHGKGFMVSYVTKNDRPGVRQSSSSRGIRVYRAYSDWEGIPVLRSLYPRMFRLWGSLRKADSDYYYKRGPRYAGLVALYCLVHRKKFIFAGANNWNFFKKFNFGESIGDTILDGFDRWGIKKANFVFVQSEKQKGLLFDNFKKNGFIFNNIGEKRNLTKDEKFILWVANIKPQKRPKTFLDIADAYPDLKFKMIGGMVDGYEYLYDEIYRRSRKMLNLEFFGFQSLKNTEKIFDDASVFINTSCQDAEGFPNTFLQSWARGISVMSYFDIDQIIQTNGLGVILKEEIPAKNVIHEMMTLKISSRKKIQMYFENHHLPETYLNRLEEVLMRERNQSF